MTHHAAALTYYCLMSLFPAALLSVSLLGVIGQYPETYEAIIVGAVYGAFAGAIILVGWLWLTNVALLFGAELNAEIEREHELADGVPPAETINLPAKTG